MNIYFISGLGADERAFSKLKLPKEWNLIYLGWPENSPDDTVESYARKYIPLIDVKNKFVLVGLSFGGMIVTELAKILHPERSIIISSISISMQLSSLMKFFRKTDVVKILPSPVFRNVPPLGNWYLGVTSNDEKMLLKDFIKHSSPEFLKWAVQTIVHWENKIKPDNLFHIHGDKDHIFPISKVKADYVVKGGGHFMVYNMPEVVSRVIVEKAGIMSDELRVVGMDQTLDS